MNIIKKMGGRKVVASLIAVILFTTAVYVAGDVPDNYLKGILAVIGIFTAGNGVEHISKSGVAKKRAEKQTDMSGRMDELDNKLDDVTTEMSELRQSLEGSLAQVTEQLGKKAKGGQEKQLKKLEEDLSKIKEGMKQSSDAESLNAVKNNLAALQQSVDNMAEQNLQLLNTLQGVMNGGQR